MLAKLLQHLVGGLWMKDVYMLWGREERWVMLLDGHGGKRPANTWREHPDGLDGEGDGLVFIKVLAADFFSAPRHRAHLLLYVSRQASVSSSGKPQHRHVAK